jgi:hypothetical protein
MADMTEAQVKILEKVIGDEEFRKSFFKDPDAAVAQAGIAISEEEMADLKALDAADFNAAMADYDARISKSGTGLFDMEAGIKDVIGVLFGRKK